MEFQNNMYCKSLTRFERRKSCEVRIGKVTIGGDNPVVPQTMTDTDTNDTEECVAQIGRIVSTGGRIVRLTAQGIKEGHNLNNIVERCRELYPQVAVVADVHFVPAVASVAAESVDKVRINPGNYRDKGGDLEALIEQCRRRGVALRIGVNHGSLSADVVDRWGDTPEGMVVSAMDYLRVCKQRDFDQVVVSMKSSNVRVMVYAYRQLVAAMAQEDMHYPIHLGVTEAGNGAEGRVKSAVGIGALLSDGIGDTIRVSLTEPPENEIPVARQIIDYLSSRDVFVAVDEIEETSSFSPFSYRPRQSDRVGSVGSGLEPKLWSEMSDEERKGCVVAVADSGNPVAEWRSTILNMTSKGDMRPVVLRRSYVNCSIEELRIRAAVDFGVMFIDGLADGIDIRCEEVDEQDINSMALDILQASRVRISKTEYIACPGCGRTMYDLQGTLAKIKERTGHLKGLKIGVMGCIVNGPGEMADADYGYVGAGVGRISLYRDGQMVMKNIPQEQALDALEQIIREDGRWKEGKE